MKEKILKISIASMLVITLTAINLVSVGAGLVTYALENDVQNNTSTNTNTTTTSINTNTNIGENENQVEATQTPAPTPEEIKAEAIANGDLVTVSSEVDNQKIYKGSLYAGVEKQYTTKTHIQVNQENVAEIIYVNENATNIPTEYLKTTVNKKELMAILGEEGILELSTKNADGTTTPITTITKTSTENEQGNIEIAYPQSINNLVIRTTKAITSGTINLEHLKVIRNVDIKELRNTNQMVATLNGTYQINKEERVIPEVTNTTELAETTTKATLEVDRTNLSTVEPNENVLIKATLNSNSEENDLYEDPSLRIEFPADVTEVKINNIAKLYGDEYTNEHIEQATENGRQVIKIALKGSQTEYKDTAIQGTEIVIDANLALNNKATSKTDTLKMTYRNENATKYENEGPEGIAQIDMSIISPKTLIAVNSINALGIETIGEEEKVSQEIEKDASAKTVTVSSEIINNNETKINNISIVGVLGTDNKENNMHAKMASEVTTTNPQSLTYYTENEEADSDISNPENKWQVKPTENSKKYLVVIPEMEVAQSVSINYNMLIPEGLQANQKTTTGYEAGYTQSDIGVHQEVQATNIELTTGAEEVKENKEQEETNLQETTKPSENENINQEEIQISVGIDKYSGTGGFIQVGGNTSYIAKIKNTTNQDKENVKIKWNLSDKLAILSQLQFSEEAYNQFLNPEFTGEGEIKTLSNELEQTIKVPANSTQIIYILVEAKNIGNSKSEEYKISMNAEESGKTYTSKEITGAIKSDNQYELSLMASKENEYLKSGDTIEYTVDIKNNNEIAAPGLALEDSIPEELTIKEVTIGNQPQQIEVQNNKLILPIDFQAGEEKQVKILTTVNYKANMEEKEIANKATLYTTSGENKETNEVKHNLLAEERGQNVYNEDGRVVSNGTSGEYNSSSTERKIKGYAWEDSNRDGQRQDSEKTLSGIKVQLINISENKLATRTNGEQITATTNDQGNYELSDVPQGEYLALFEYDSSTYKPTEYKSGNQSSKNSNVVAKKANIDGEEKTYGVTDTLKVTENNISNINIGLAKSEKFDLKLEKTVSKIITQTSEGNKEQTFENETLAKAEIHRKQIEGANVIVEYKIKVSNVGELDGYVKNIVDYLPSELTFSSELNKDWYQEGNNLYNNTLANKKISAGDSKEVTLTLTKKMTKENTGTIKNTAEISEDYNNAGVTDINSTPANQKQGENDMSSADVIISVSTGETEITIILAIIAVLVLAAVAFFIRRELKLRENM